MTDEQITHFNKTKFAEMPDEIRDKAIQGLKKHIPEGSREGLKRMILAYGNKWWTEGGWHFYGGMTIRNLLRNKIGIPDTELPSGNWDDYYIPCLEASLDDVIIQAGLPMEPYDGE